MSNIDVKVIEEFKKHLQDGTPMTGLVKMVSPTEGLLLEFGALKVVVPTEEIEAFQEIDHFPFLAGRTIEFMVISVDEEAGVVVGSRKKVQEANYEDVLQRLLAGEVLEGTITNIVSFGAYVEIKGVPGLLKNYNFASDTTLIREVKSEGDTVAVKFHKQSENGKIQLVAAEKYCSPTALKFEDFEKGQSIVGTVVSIKPFGIFVRIASDVDALCPFPEIEHEIVENCKVSMVVTRIREEEQRIAGKIKKVIPIE